MGAARHRDPQSSVERTLLLGACGAQDAGPVKLTFAEDDERLDATKLVGYSVSRSQPGAAPVAAPARAPVTVPVTVPVSVTRPAPLPVAVAAPRSALPAIVVPWPRVSPAVPVARRAPRSRASLATLAVGILLVDLLVAVVWYALST